MIGWKFESGKTLNRGHREKTANQKRKGSSKKTPVQRSAQYKTKGKTIMSLLWLHAVVPLLLWNMARKRGWSTNLWIIFGILFPLPTALVYWTTARRADKKAAQEVTL